MQSALYVNNWGYQLLTLVGQLALLDREENKSFFSDFLCEKKEHDWWKIALKTSYSAICMCLEWKTTLPDVILFLFKLWSLDTILALMDSSAVAAFGTFLRETVNQGKFHSFSLHSSQQC